VKAATAQKEMSHLNDEEKDFEYVDDDQKKKPVKNAYQKNRLNKPGAQPFTQAQYNAMQNVKLS